MINSKAVFEHFDAPYPHYRVSGLLSPADLRRLNADLPPWRLFRREIKEGPGHTKTYRMWLMDLYDHDGRAPGTAELPAPWSELLDDLLSEEFAALVRDGLGIDVSELALTLGIYRYEDGDYTSVSTGKATKVIHWAFYLNESWTPEEGGAMHLWTANDAEEPAVSIVPVGGTTAVMFPSEVTWHNIGKITTGSTKDRINIMIEYWKA